MNVTDEHQTDGNTQHIAEHCSSKMKFNASIDAFSVCYTRMIHWPTTAWNKSSGNKQINISKLLVNTIDATRTAAIRQFFWVKKYANELPGFWREQEIFRKSQTRCHRILDSVTQNILKLYTSKFERHRSRTTIELRWLTGVGRWRWHWLARSSIRVPHALTRLPARSCWCSSCRVTRRFALSIISGGTSTASHQWICLTTILCAAVAVIRCCTATEPELRPGAGRKWRSVLLTIQLEGDAGNGQQYPQDTQR